MAEPSSGLCVGGGVLCALGLRALFPDLDLAALVGSFGGAFVYVVWNKDLKPMQRVFYWLIGWIGGYFGAAELMGWKWTQTAGWAAFVCSAFGVGLIVSILEAVKSGELPRWVQWVFRVIQFATTKGPKT